MSRTPHCIHYLLWQYVRYYNNNDKERNNNERTFIYMYIYIYLTN